MKKYYFLTCLVGIISFVLFTNQCYGTITTASTGNWSTPGTWDNGVPTCGDTIVIASNVTVTITGNVNLDENSGCSIPIHLQIDGTLHFNTGRKMYLSCNSFVAISSGGSLEKGNGGGNSNVIDICQTTVWSAGSGTQSGPTTYGTGTPLPITLIEFKALNSGNTVILEWITTSEINNDFFTIERAHDALTFEVILIHNGAGNSRNSLYYKIIDDNPLVGINYYRLKQTDFNGEFAYSHIIAINVKKAISEVYSIAPNPSGNQFRIISNNEANGFVIVKIYNSIAQLIREMHVSDFQEPIDVSNLNSGLYTLYISDKHNVLIESKKLIIR